MEPLNHRDAEWSYKLSRTELSSDGCNSWQAWNRRRILRSAGTLAACTAITGPSFMTYVAESLAQNDDKKRPNRIAKRMIVLWLQGGPSQLETFDPHAGSIIGGDTRTIETSAMGIEISHMLPRCAEIMDRVTLVRSMVSKEGDHERATYNMKTGWRPDPTLIHPAIGSVICHQTTHNIEIPRHISILTGQWPARGGYLGNEFDAFQMQDPLNPLPNLKSYTAPGVLEKRLDVLQNVVESEFRRGRLRDLDRKKTSHESATRRATTMMSSEQIKAFEVALEPHAIRSSFGDTPFGRGCLAAVRLMEQGVTCVEVELSGWDSHVDNHSIQQARCNTLDAALHATIIQLQERDLFEDTIVLCGGEFGRTPQINVAGGRDHWPTGFSVLIAGGPFRRGFVFGETTSELIEKGKNPLQGVNAPVLVEDLHATLLHAMGIPFQKELITPIGRPLALSQGNVVSSLLS